MCSSAMPLISFWHSDFFWDYSTPFEFDYRAGLRHGLCLALNLGIHGPKHFLDSCDTELD